MSLPLTKLDKFFRRLSSESKKRNFNPSLLKKLLYKARDYEGICDKVTILRFALRLARNGGLKTDKINDDLAQIYSSQTSDTLKVSKSLQYRGWANRYGISIDTKKLEREILHYINAENSLFYKLRLLVDSDVNFLIIPETNTIQIYLDEKWIPIKYNPILYKIYSIIIGYDSEGMIRKKNQSWEIVAETLTGKQENVKNDDSLGIAYFKTGEILIAIADGTGDSQFGGRASWIALDTLINAYSISSSLKIAVELAASKIRSDNMIHHLDGACTLVAGIISGNKMVAMACGDSFYTILREDNKIESSSIDFQKRKILGGEPLGQIVTSNGRLVDTLIHVKSDDFENIENPKRFLFGSDGLLLDDVKESSGYLTALVSKQKEPIRIVDKSLSRSLAAFKAGVKADNITSLAGVRL